jgi:plasmid stabilization system protein ParE
VTRTIHREAEADVAEAVRHYKSEAGVGVARRFLAEFERVARLLEDNPRLGTPSDSGRRSFPMAVFSVETGLRILVVRHQRRDSNVGAERT